MASAMPRSSDSGPGWAPGHVDEGHDREAEPLGELHDPHRLAVALGMGHPEVAPDVLVRLGALLLADHDEPVAVDPGKARHDRLVVAECAVAVELHELIGHRRHELERVGALDVPGELDACPDGARGSAVSAAIRAASSCLASRRTAAQAIDHGLRRRCSGPIPPRWSVPAAAVRRRRSATSESGMTCSASAVRNDRGRNAGSRTVSTASAPNPAGTR